MCPTVSAAKTDQKSFTLLQFRDSALRGILTFSLAQLNQKEKWDKVSISLYISLLLPIQTLLFKSALMRVSLILSLAWLFTICSSSH